MIASTIAEIRSRGPEALPFDWVGNAGTVLSGKKRGIWSRPQAFIYVNVRDFTSYDADEVSPTQVLSNECLPERPPSNHSAPRPVDRRKNTGRARTSNLKIG